MGRAFTFLWERFPPLIYLPLIGALYAAAMRQAGGAPDLDSALGAAALTLVFLHLRLFDERKDYEHDKLHNPRRPLPRGLITVRELTVAWRVVVGVELALALAVGVAPALALGVVVLYSYVMLNEFWAGGWLRPRLLTYAVTHTAITPLMLLFVATVESGEPFWAPPAGYLPFALAGWPLFLVFEVARKTYAPEDERDGVNTYSSLHSPRGAAALTLLFAGLATAAVPRAWPCLALLAVGSLPYVVRPTPRGARLLQAAATAFLFLFFVVAALP